LLRHKRLADILKSSEFTVYKLASSGKLAGFRIVDSWQFNMDLIMIM